MTSQRVARPLSEHDYELVRALVREHSGIELNGTRRSDLDLAVLEALQAAGVDGAGELCAYLSVAEGRSALAAFLEALTVRESHFFRSRAQFDALRAEVIPGLLAARHDARRLRVWSAGCATGEEPYSLAIVLERLLPQIDDWDVLVLATDISAAALETARRGVYRQWSFREVPEDIKQRYFTQRGDQFEVLRRIRDRVTFASLNLVADRHPSLLSNTVEMDLVLCRNVLIYFSEAVGARVVGRLCDALAEGGWLVLGPAEAGLASQVGLVPRRISGTLMHQKAGNAIGG